MIGVCIKEDLEEKLKIMRGWIEEEGGETKIRIGEVRF